MATQGRLLGDGEEVSALSPTQNMIELAIKQAASVEVLDKLLLMREREVAAEAKREFAAAYVQMKARLPKVIRLKTNGQTKSKYAPLEDINQAIDPTLQAYGFGTATHIVKQDADSVTVRAELWHSAGHVESTEITMPLDKAGIEGKVNKTGPWALSSSVTYAKRVAVCALLNISTGDDTDGQGSAGEPMDNLKERLDWIASASAKELFKIWKDAFDAAEKMGDKNAMRQLTDARDKRRKELGQ